MRRQACTSARHRLLPRGRARLSSPAAELLLPAVELAPPPATTLVVRGRSPSSACRQSSSRRNRGSTRPRAPRCQGGLAAAGEAPARRNMPEEGEGRGHGGRSANLRRREPCRKKGGATGGSEGAAGAGLAPAAGELEASELWRVRGSGCGRGETGQKLPFSRLDRKPTGMGSGEEIWLLNQISGPKLRPCWSTFFLP